MRPFGGLHQASCRFARHVTAGIALSRRAAGGQHSVNWLQSATTYIQSCCRWQPNFAMSKLNDMSRLAESLACLAGLWCAAGVYAQTLVDVHSHIIVQEYVGMLCLHDAALEETSARLRRALEAGAVLSARAGMFLGGDAARLFGINHFKQQ